MAQSVSPAMSRVQPALVRRRRWPFVVGAGLAALVALVALWDWDWFRPMVEARASAALGRAVTVEHVHLRLGRSLVARAEGVRIANPEGFDQGTPFAAAERLTVTLDAMELLRRRAVVLTDILVERPRLDAEQRADGSANYLFPALATGGGEGMKIGALRVTDGTGHVTLARLRADFDITAASRDAALVAEAHGTYAAQKIDAQFTGGGLLGLRDAATPYPVDLRLRNGATTAHLAGSVRNPLNFAGADLTLELAGTNMEDLLPLVGIAFPKTPSYRVAGKLAMAEGKIHFTDIAGQVGSSDIGGSLDVDPAPERPVVTANLTSRVVDLADLGGFIGSEPGRLSTPNQTPEQRQAVARAEADPRLIPTRTISLPKLRAADVHLVYRGAKILGRDMPFDSLSVEMDIVDGHIALHPVDFGIGPGHIAGTIQLDPMENGQFRTRADVRMQRVDLARLLKGGGIVSGAGLFGGRAVLDSTGNSMATLLGNGNGSLQLSMAGGGSIRSLLVALSGLQFGNSLLAALGVPRDDSIQCFVADFALQRGVLVTRALLLDTTSDIVSGTGTIDLRREAVDYTIKTDAKHFSIGSLPAPIHVYGSFKDTGAMPNIAVLAARTGAAVGLGFAFPPAAILPTIQLGVGDDGRCAALAARK